MAVMEKNMTDCFGASAYSPFSELLAYELLWSEHNSSMKQISEVLTKRQILPSQVVMEKYGFVLP
jgi:hypothetical protein